MRQSDHQRQAPQAAYGSNGQQMQAAGVPTGFAPAMQNTGSGAAYSSGSSVPMTNGYASNRQMTNGMEAQGLKAQHVAQFGSLDGAGRNQQMRQPWHDSQMTNGQMTGGMQVQGLKTQHVAQFGAMERNQHMGQPWQGSVADSRNSFNPGGGQYWGVPLQERPQHFLFGYGSLMNSESRGSTSGKVTAAVPVRLSAEFGYIREWNFRSPTSKLTALGIRKRLPGEAGSTINGVIYPVEGGSIEKFDEREEGYTRVQVPRNMIEAVGWISLPKEGQIWVYVPDGPSGEAGVGLPLPDAFYPVLQSYIDICVTGALEYGEDFAREFLETTFGWGPYWLNDRELPRRPWVHQKKYKIVDAMLGKWPMDPRRNALHLRRLPTEYGLHFANQFSR